MLQKCCIDVKAVRLWAAMSGEMSLAVLTVTMPVPVFA